MLVQYRYVVGMHLSRAGIPYAWVPRQRILMLVGGLGITWSIRSYLCRNMNRVYGTCLSAFSCLQLYYHIVGTSAAEDIKVFEDPSQPLWNVGAEVSPDGRLLLISVS